MASSRKSADNSKDTGKEDTGAAEAPAAEAAQSAAQEAPASAPAEEPAEKAPQAPSAPAPPAPPAAGRAGGLAALLAGGILAGAVGFGAAQYANGAWPFQRAEQGPSETERLRQSVAAQAERIAALEAQAERLASDLAQLPPPPDISPLASGLEGLGARLDGLSSRLDGLEQRVADLENRPLAEAGASAEAVAAYERELAAMRQMLEEELARIRQEKDSVQERQASAAEQARQVLQQAALASLRAAIADGAPFAAPLQELAATGVEVPRALADLASEGVPTLATLQAQFPQAARAALAAAIRAEADQGRIDRFTAFLRTQLGARSLEPREGDDPDAVLSRAEAALRKGNLARALSELEALPEAGREIMADWVAAASRRLQAERAVADLAARLNG